MITAKILAQEAVHVVTGTRDHPAARPRGHERMKALRLAKQWSQRRLAREADVSEADISRIETGRQVPYRGQAEKIARALDIAVAVLFPER